VAEEEKTSVLTTKKTQFIEDAAGDQEEEEGFEDEGRVNTNLSGDDEEEKQ